MIYSALLKYGTSNFSLDILEYCEPNILISREQYYIDTLNPEYNILKIAGSRLGCKHTFKTKKAMSVAGRRSKFINTSVTTITDTELKLSLRTQCIKVKVFDNSNNLVKEFASIKLAAKYFNLSYLTIFKIFKTGISYDNFIYRFESKDLRIWVYNCNHKLIEILNNQRTVIKLYNIPRSTLFGYIKSGKLYKNKFYFYNINSKFNPYFNHKNDYNLMVKWSSTT